MLTLKAGPAYPHLEHTNRVSFFGSQIDYFVSDQVSIGLNLNYMQYYEMRYYAVPIDYIDPNDYLNKWMWYSLGLSAKFLSDLRGPSPYMKLGAGFYIPRMHHRVTRWIPEENPDFGDIRTGRSHLALIWEPGCNILSRNVSLYKLKDRWITYSTRAKI